MPLSTFLGLMVVFGLVGRQNPGHYELRDFLIHTPADHGFLNWNKTIGIVGQAGDRTMNDIIGVTAIYWVIFSQAIIKQRSGNHSQYAESIPLLETGPGII